MTSADHPEEAGAAPSPPRASASPAPGQRRAAPAIRAGCVVLVAAVLHLAVVVAGTASWQRDHPPTCYGIGWGCTPDPITSGLLWGAIFVAPAVLGVLILLALSTALPGRRARRSTAYGLAGLAAAAALLVPWP